MKIGNIELAELAFACYVYNLFTNFDKSYTDFMNRINGSLDLGNSEHRRELISWLNKWGCRHFAQEFLDTASKSLFDWYCSYSSTLMDCNEDILELNDRELEVLGDAFDNLSKRLASYRGNNIPVKIGPTGASKILFVLRPNAHPTWDVPVRNHLHYKGNKQYYIKFLKHVKYSLENIGKQCLKHGFTLSDLPKRIVRKKASLPKLIDEYYWVTITKKCRLPDLETLKFWYSWRK